MTIRSKNTGHIWYICNPEYLGECIIFHKHRKFQESGAGGMEYYGALCVPDEWKEAHAAAGVWCRVNESNVPWHPDKIGRD